MAKEFTRRDRGRRDDPETYSDAGLIAAHCPRRREKGDPSEGPGPITIFAQMFFIATAGFAFCYFGRTTGDFSGSRCSSEVSGPVVSASTGPKPVEKQIKDGEKLFAQNCVVCHQATGLGVPNAFPPLAGSSWVHGDPGRIINITGYGVGGPIEVSGQHFNGSMPAICESLSDQKVADIVTYVRQAWGNKADAVSADTVKAERAKTGKRGPWTAAELLQKFPLEKK